MAEYFDLGTYSRPISTRSGTAQTWFNRGLIWCYGYNHDESERCFRLAAEADPTCAIAYWGIGYAAGPNYNKQWDALDEQDMQRTLVAAHEASRQALALADDASAVEKALIGALCKRHPAAKHADDFNVWNDDYAQAMREVYAEFSDDLDVATLFAEAMMNRTPWALWDLDSGKPAEGADTEEAIAVLEKALAQMEAAGEERHPGLIHLYIHMMEMSPHPELALRYADELRDLVPDSGHLCHMPTHIDVLCGQYHDVVVSNHKAIVADRKFLAKEGPLNYYSTYRVHDYHFKLYGAMFLGSYQAAMEAANELYETLPEEVLRIESPPMADWVEGFVGMKMHAFIRFGKWQAILDEPLPSDPDLYCMTTAVQRYARTIAFASLERVSEALNERERFREAVEAVPESRLLFNNTCRDILAVAQQMLLGELEYRQANYDAAFSHLRRAVELDDNLPYDEPWGWMQPARHALGALLLEQGHVEQSEAVYRADLGLDSTLRRPCQHPNNVWSLHGLHECLVRQGKLQQATLIKTSLDMAVARADVPIKASCYCRLHAVA